MPDAYIHYSPVYVERFLPTEYRDGYFMTQTQGFLYVTRADSLAGSSTTFARPNSALLFVGEAARQFKLHPLWDPLFIKRIWAQCVSRQRFHDWRWELKDTRRIGSVLVISRMYPVPMDRHSPLDAFFKVSARARLTRMKRLYRFYSCVMGGLIAGALLVSLYALYQTYELDSSLSLNTRMELFGRVFDLGKIGKWLAGGMLAAVLAGFVVTWLRKNRFLEHTLRHIQS